MSLPKIALLLFDAVTLSTALIYAYSVISQKFSTARACNALMGVTFGVATVISMLTPIILADGVNFDISTLIIGLSSAFFGLIGGGLTLAIAIGAQEFVGPGLATPVLAGMLVACGIGLLWSFGLYRYFSSPLSAHTVLGTLVSLHVAAGFFLSASVSSAFFTEVLLTLTAVNFISCLVIGTMLHREAALLIEKETLLDAAKTDPLTSLLNRRSALDAYQSLSAPGMADEGIAMICFDVDRFKMVNDQYGHIFGDQVLTEVSARIATILRPSDVFARFGGDEFLIVLPNVDVAQTKVIAERCRAAVADTPITTATTKAQVTISIGFEWAPQVQEFTNFVSSADKALYRAKELGRNCVANALQHAAASKNAHDSRQLQPVSETLA